MFLFVVSINYMHMDYKLIEDDLTFMAKQLLGEDVFIRTYTSGNFWFRSNVAFHRTSSDANLI